MAGVGKGVRGKKKSAGEKWVRVAKRGNVLEGPAGEEGKGDFGQGKKKKAMSPQRGRNRGGFCDRLSLRRTKNFASGHDRMRTCLPSNKGRRAID